MDARGAGGDALFAANFFLEMDFPLLIPVSPDSPNPKISSTS
jgi:hypothetical protein